MQSNNFAIRFNLALTRAGVPHGRPRVRETRQLLGCSREAARQWVNGLVKPKYESVQLIAERLHVSPGWLIHGEGSMLNGHDHSSEVVPSLPACADRDHSLSLTGWPALAEKALQLIVATGAGMLLGMGALKTYELWFVGETLAGC